MNPAACLILARRDIIAALEIGDIDADEAQHLNIAAETDYYAELRHDHDSD